MHIVYQDDNKDKTGFITNLTTKVESYKVLVNWDWP